MLSGAALVQDVRDCVLAPGQAAFWWLGQHSFIVKLGQTVCFIDPYLSPSPRRQTPALLAPAELAMAPLVLGTHDHSDHIDRPVWPAIAAAAPELRFVVPDLLIARLAKDLGLPASRFLGLDDGQHLTVGELTIHAVAAAHEFLDRDPATGRYPYLGYLLKANGFTLYHAGDTCIYEGLMSKVAAFQPDLALLPINGRDGRRLKHGTIGNMTWQEAVDFAGTLAPALAVPTHWDMFPGNTEDPGLFVDYLGVKYPTIPTLIPRPGMRVVVKAKGA